jgi:hypothetical protein
MSEIDAKMYFVDKPAYEVIPTEEVRGRQPAMTLMSSNLIPGARLYIEAGWVCDMPDPPTHIYEHTHDYDEIVIHLGTDPDNREELGGEIEFMMDGQPLTIDKTSAIFVPKGVKHGPLTWKRFEKPHIEMTIMLGAGTLAEADPGGHEKRKGE